ncbi:RxLR effector protein [Phytophthora megakarya]|uniref:RxLR effector protein n=1 Tax=Phytophthora megakarya TaxID=4795 RepID=A0A225UP17_9STRA|nr:RxLR effector protein [Phytophthora megakarya]
MRLSYSFFALIVVLTVCSKSSAVSKIETMTANKMAISATPLAVPRYLRGVKIHDNRSAEHGEQEERGGFDKILNKFRYQSQGAHGAEDLNPKLVQQLRENPKLFEQMRANDDLRRNIFSAWRGVKVHSGEVKTAMKNQGYTKEEYKQFVDDYKKFKPENLSF